MNERYVRTACDRALRVPEVRAEHGVDPVHAVRGNAAHQIFFHIDDVRGQIDRDQPRPACPARSCRASASKPSARAPPRVALPSSDEARTSGASRRMAASSENMFRSSLLARLSVPMATVTPGVVEPAHGRVAGADILVAARAGHQGRARLLQPQQIVIGELRAMHHEQARPEESSCRRGTPPARSSAACHVGVPRAEILRAARGTDRRLAEELHFFRRFAQVHRRGHHRQPRRPRT